MNYVLDTNIVLFYLKDNKTLKIAATTIVTGSELVTSDKDFEHLDKAFFKVNLVKP